MSISPLRYARSCTLLGLLVSPSIGLHAAATNVVDVSSYADLQAAIDANPGRLIQLAPGEYTIHSALKITASGTELLGPARIVQTNPAEPMLQVKNTQAVRVSDLAFTRAKGQQEASTAGIEVEGCDDVVLSKLRVTENHSRASIWVSATRDATVTDCTVLNYKGFAIDDRTKSPLMGYAFKAIDGTGIQFRNVQGGTIRNNRIEEHRLLPTKAIHDENGLGTLTVVPKEKTRLMSEDMIKTRYTNNWHQGAAIQVAMPEQSRQIVITGNIIEHPAQGVDSHADNVIISNNLINYCMTGIKAVHGSKNVLITGNQVSYVDLRGIELHAGNASHESANASGTTKVAGENLDGGTVVSNNVFSHFGHGEQNWNWEKRGPRHVINITSGPREELPPLRDVLITGNVVYDNGRDTVLVDGQWVKVPPRYDYALFVEQEGSPQPLNIRASANLFHAGSKGETNLPSVP